MTPPAAAAFKPHVATAIVLLTVAMVVLVLAVSLGIAEDARRNRDRRRR